jgi:hypothetical protein
LVAAKAAPRAVFNETSEARSKPVSPSLGQDPFKLPSQVTNTLAPAVVLQNVKLIHSINSSQHPPIELLTIESYQLIADLIEAIHDEPPLKK